MDIHFFCWKIPCKTTYARISIHVAVDPPRGPCQNPIWESVNSLPAATLGLVRVSSDLDSRNFLSFVKTSVKEKIKTEPY